MVHSDYQSLYQLANNKGFREYNSIALERQDDIIALPSFNIRPGSNLEHQPGTQQGIIHQDSINNFRIFIPPGSTSFGLGYFMSVLGYYAIVVRWKTPPDNIKQINSEEDYLSFEFDKTNRYSLQDLSKRNYYFQKSESIVVYSGASSDILMEGGWLYVKRLYAHGYVISSLKSNTHVDREKYTEWYNQAQWDEHGDPIG